MNIKSNLVKSAIGAAVVSAALTAYASLPKQPTEPVYVMAPFKIESISLKNSTAELLTEDEKFSLEIEFDAEYYVDGNGYESWRDAEIKEIKDIHVYDENGEIQAYVDRLDVVEIKDLIEQGIRERI